MEFETNFFFSLFRAISFPFWLKIMSERGYVIFWIFLLFFSEFSCRVEYKRISGLKFFSLFLGLSNPILAKNNAGMRFFKILNFFAIFSQNFLARVEYELNLGLNFFFLFLGRSHPGLAKNNVGKRFFNFLNFFAIFFGIFLHGSRMNEFRD